MVPVVVVVVLVVVVVVLVSATIMVLFLVVVVLVVFVAADVVFVVVLYGAQLSQIVANSFVTIDQACTPLANSCEQFCDYRSSVYSSGK